VLPAAKPKRDTLAAGNGTSKHPCTGAADSAEGDLSPADEAFHSAAIASGAGMIGQNRATAFQHAKADHDFIEQRPS
jgi:hypothetical protein